MSDINVTVEVVEPAPVNVTVEIAGERGPTGPAGPEGPAGSSSLPSGTPNKVLATDASGAATSVSVLRALVALDIPEIAISKTTGLQTALDAKAASTHTHPATDISDSTSAGRAMVTAADAAAQAALLPAMVGDSGSGGTKGQVPAPAAGDAAAIKFLKADATWAAIPSGGGAVYFA